MRRRSPADGAADPPIFRNPMNPQTTQDEPGDQNKRERRTGSGPRVPLPGGIPIVYKLSMVISILMVVCIGLLALVITQHQNQVLRQQLDDLGNTLAAQIASSAVEHLLKDDQPALGFLTTNLAEDRNISGIAILSADGNVVAQAGITPFNRNAPLAGASLDVDPSSLHGLEWLSRLDERLPEQNVVAFMSPVRVKQVTAGHVVVTLSRSILDKSMETARHSILFASTLVIIVGVLLTYLLSRRLSRPIHDLIDASRALDEGYFDFRFQERRNDEIGRLMSSLNRMAEGRRRLSR
jgi:adenylate cyclase